MKTALLIIAFLSLSSLELLAEQKHEHGHSESAQLQLNSGKKWETDAPLRAGMTGVKDALASKLDKIHDGTLTKPQYVELADTVLKHTDSIFKNCKLSPKADAQLHTVLAQILDGTSKMKSAESTQGQQQGAVKIVKALQQYPKYFDHPGWQPLKH